MLVLMMTNFEIVCFFFFFFPSSTCVRGGSSFAELHLSVRARQAISATANCAVASRALSRSGAARLRARWLAKA